MAQAPGERDVAEVEITVTPEMEEAGVKALREWLDQEDRLCLWDHFAVRDAFLAMHACMVASQ